MTNRFYGAFDFEHLPGSRPVNDYRSPFQVDRDRILFSTPFRQLQSKTQVFQSGEYDFYRTRLTHTIEVARIGRSIAEYLNQTDSHLREDFRIDADLVEAVGLAHDIGHPPFGHIGERKLNALMAEYGGFEGNAQTLRIAAETIYPREHQPTGMKPTRAFADGIMKYKALFHECRRSKEDGTPVAPKNHFLYDSQEPLREFVIPESTLKGSSPISPDDWNQIQSLECQIMDWADDTAYSLHDIVDGVRARFITPEALDDWAENRADLSDYQCTVLEELIHAIRTGSFEPRAGQRIGEFVQACRLATCDSPLQFETNRHRFRLALDNHVREVCQLHKRIAVDLIFRSHPLQEIEFKGGSILERLFHAYAEHYLGSPLNRLQILPAPYAVWIRATDDTAARARIICDYLSSLTDTQALRIYRKLFDADFSSIMELG